MKTKIFTRNFLFSLAILFGNVIHAQNFTKITEGPMVNDGIVIQSAGCTWGDFDNDGDEDLFVTNGVLGNAQKNFLFRNEGPENNFAFVKVEQGNIVNDIAHSRAASWGDYDNDGNLDLFVANQIENNNYLYHNNGDGTFTRIVEGAVAYDLYESEPVSWIDYDNDGYLDIFVGNANTSHPNNLYHNNGDGTFSRILDDPLAKDYGNGTFSWCDFDNDGDYDMLAGYFLQNTGALFLNNGNGSFTKISKGMVLNDPEEGLHAGDWVDFDNDGDWDIFDLCNWDIININLINGIYINEGPVSNYQFTKKTKDIIEIENYTWTGSSWSDIDNDGDLDMFLTSYDNYNVLFSNNGDGTLTKITVGEITNESSVSLGSAWADYDQDGDMDLYIANLNNNNSFYKNDNNNGNSWIKIKLKGTASNASALGAVIKVKAITNTEQVWQMRSIGGQTSIEAQNSLIAHFGLGKASFIDSLVILWPAGHKTVLTNVPVNQQLIITEEIPEFFLRAEFGANTTKGINEFTVQFTDKSLFDPNNPVKSWSWDFNGDGTEDSNEQNPEHTFSFSEGDVYDVSLVVSNGIKTDTITRSQLIKIYSLESNFCLAGKATASSESDLLLSPQMVIDGSKSTSWKSGPEHNEWLKIDLGSVQNIGKIVIQWTNTNYADKYRIQTSVNDVDWETIYYECSGNGKEDVLLFTGVAARFIKMEGIHRKGSNAFVILEFEIYASDGNTYPEKLMDCNVTGITGFVENSGFSIYPNPAKNIINIEFNQEINYKTTINLLDITGKVLYSKPYVNDTHIEKINLSGLTNGMYFIKICTNDKVEVEKFVKD